jgi:hypothetical protein
MSELLSLRRIPFRNILSFRATFHTLLNSLVLGKKRGEYEYERKLHRVALLLWRQRTATFCFDALCLTMSVCYIWLQSAGHEMSDTSDVCYKTVKLWLIALPPNVVVEWLALLLRIREVPRSNLGPETGYPNWGFSWFSSVPPGECRDRSLKLSHDRFLPNPFQFIIQLPHFHLTLFSLSC